FFGARIAEMARRHDADLVELTAPLGRIVPLEQVEETLCANPDTKLVAIVHAETSTGVRYPVSELAELVRATAPETLLMVDAVTSLGGERVEPAGWGIDFGYSCSQKSLGCPPGLSPFTASPRALEVARAKKRPAPFTYDVEELRRYWVERPITYHHTM